MIQTLDQRNPQEFGERLRAARSGSGLTQEEASKALSLSRTTLVAIEKGQRRVRPTELRQLAELYKVSVNSLLRESAIHVDLVPQFRALSSSREPAIMEAARLLNSLAAAEVELEERLGLPLKKNLPPEYRIVNGDLRMQAEDVAMEMRNRYGIGQGPINDILSMLELDVGIRIFTRRLDSSISGLFIFDDKLGACILLNQNHPRERRAVTGAHEFGHLISARKSPDVLDKNPRLITKEDRFANYFASSFMLPAVSVRRRFHEMRQESGRFAPRHLILMAHYFNVSEEAMCRRLEDLDLVSKGTWEVLKDRGFSGETVRHVLGDRPEEEKMVMPPRLWLLAAEAYRREEFDEGQIARMLSMDRVEVRSVLEALDVEGNDDLQAASSY